MLFPDLETARRGEEPPSQAGGKVVSVLLAQPLPEAFDYLAPTFA